MNFGCHLPMFGPVATRDNVLAFARRTEALGYESLWASDHIVIPHRIESRYPYSDTAGDLVRYCSLGVGTLLLETRSRDLEDMVGIYETFAREIGVRP